MSLELSCNWLSQNKPIHYQSPWFASTCKMESKLKFVVLFVMFGTVTGSKQASVSFEKILPVGTNKLLQNFWFFIIRSYDFVRFSRVQALRNISSRNEFLEYWTQALCDAEQTISGFKGEGQLQENGFSCWHWQLQFWIHWHSIAQGDPTIQWKWIWLWRQWCWRHLLHANMWRRNDHR